MGGTLCIKLLAKTLFANKIGYQEHWFLIALNRLKAQSAESESQFSAAIHFLKTQQNKNSQQHISRY